MSENGIAINGVENADLGELEQRAALPSDSVTQDHGKDYHGAETEFP